MLEITNFRSGAILNARNGQEEANQLIVPIQGLADSNATVTVNGMSVRRADRKFATEVALTEKINHVAVRASGQYGDVTQEITLVWDKQSFRRYTFFIDDNIFFLNDIAHECPASLFDHFYLKQLRALHQRYGTVFTLNLFYRDDHAANHFELSAFPDSYRAEFQANSDWLRLSFHAYSEFPDRPYQHCTAEKLAADYDLVRAEVTRFAGPESFEPPLVVHWAMAHPDHFPLLRERGMRVLTGEYVDAATYVGETAKNFRTTDIGFYYEKDVALYLESNRVFYDRFTDMTLAYTNVCCNLMSQSDLKKKIADCAEHPEYHETIVLMTHEQYCYPRYAGYIPDHFERMELACRLITERGYRPVWFSRGLLGNRSWGA